MNTKTIKKNRKRLSSREKREKLTKRRLRNKMEGGVGKARARQRKRKGEKRRRNEQISNQNDIIKNNKMTPNQRGWVKFINDVYYVDYEHYLYAAKIVTQVEKEIEKIEEGSTVSIDIKLPELSKLNQLQQYITNFKVPKDMQSYVSSIPSPVELVKLDTSLKIIDKQNRINDLLEHVVLEKYVDLPMLSHILDNNLDVKGVKSLNNNINFKLKPVELVEFSKIIHAVNKSDAPMGSISDIQVLAPTQLELLQLNEAFRIIHKQEAERIAREGAIRIAKKAEREELAKKVKNTEGYIDQINELFAKGDYEGAERKIKETNSFIQDNYLRNQGILVEQVEKLSSKVNKHNEIKGLLDSAEVLFNTGKNDKSLVKLEQAEKSIGDDNDIRGELRDRKDILMKNVKDKKKSIDAQTAKSKSLAEKKQKEAMENLSNARILLEEAQTSFNNTKYSESIKEFDVAINSLQETARFITENKVEGDFNIDESLTDANNRKDKAMKANQANGNIKGAELKLIEGKYEEAIQILEDTNILIRDNGLNDQGKLVKNVETILSEAKNDKEISSLKSKFDELKNTMFKMKPSEMKNKQTFNNYLRDMNAYMVQLDSIRDGRDETNDEINNIRVGFNKYINFFNGVLPLYNDATKINDLINMVAEQRLEVTKDYIEGLRKIGITSDQELFQDINTLIDDVISYYDSFKNINFPKGTDQTSWAKKYKNNYLSRVKMLHYICEMTTRVMGEGEAKYETEYNSLSRKKDKGATKKRLVDSIIRRYKSMETGNIKEHITAAFISNLKILKKIPEDILAFPKGPPNPSSISSITPENLIKLNMDILIKTPPLPGQPP
jgi:hypothetical protein